MRRSIFLMIAVALSAPCCRSFDQQFAPLQMEAEQNLSDQDVSVRGEISAVHVAPPSTIAVQQLQHKVPRKARSEFRKGLTALKKHQAIAAQDHLKAAVALDPAYADAYTNLGVAYYRLNEYQHSLEGFQKAVELVPGDPAAK